MQPWFPPFGAFTLTSPAGTWDCRHACRSLPPFTGRGKVVRDASVSLTHFSMPPRADEPITALFDLSVDNIDDLGGAREVVDQIGDHSADGDCGDWQSVGAHGRILLDRPRQSVARNLNHHLLLAGKRVLRHAISSRSACVMLSNASFSRLAVRPKTKRLRAETK